MAHAAVRQTLLPLYTNIIKVLARFFEIVYADANVPKALRVRIAVVVATRGVPFPVVCKLDL